MASDEVSLAPLVLQHPSLSSSPFWPEMEVNIERAEVMVTAGTWLNTSLGDNVSDNVPTPREVPELRLWALVMLVFPLLTCWGNVLVVMAVYRERALRTATNYFIVSLAVADIMVGVLVMPGAVYVEATGEWLLGDVVCDMWVAFDVLCCTASIINLAAISVDRYIAVTKPIQYAKHQNSRRIYITIVITWVVSIALSSPIALGVNYTDKRVQRECTFYNSDFLIISSMCSFYIPTVVMVLLYWRIFATIRERSRQARKQHLLQQRRAQGSAATADTSVTCESFTALRALDSGRRHQQQRRIAASATSLDDRRSVSTARLHVESGSYKRQSQDSAVVVSNGGARLLVSGQQSRANSVSDRSGGGDAAKQDDLDDLLDDDDIMQPASHAHELWTRPPPSNDVFKGGEGEAAAATADETSPFLQVATNAAVSSASVAKTNVASGNAGEKLNLGLPIAQASYELSINGRRNTYCDGGAAVKILLPLNNGQHSMRSSLSSQADWSSVAFDDGAPNKMRSSFSFQLQRHRRGSSNSKEHDPNHPHHYQHQASSTSSHGSRHEKLAHKREKKATKTLAIVLGVYLFCWVPFFTINIVNAICIRYSLKDTRPECNLEPVLFSFFVWLGYINSFLNPIIYTIFNADFRRAFENILQKPCSL